VADAILVLNAGSSSLKFETFFLAGPALNRDAAAGIVEGRYSFQTAELPSRLLPARRPGAYQPSARRVYQPAAPL
jgi:hypothetical protein